MERMSKVYCDPGFKELMDKVRFDLATGLVTRNITEVSRTLMIEIPHQGYIVPIKYREWVDFSKLKFEKIEVPVLDWRYPYTECHNKDIILGPKFLNKRGYELALWLERQIFIDFLEDDNFMMNPGESAAILDNSSHIISISRVKPAPDEDIKLTLIKKKGGLK